MKLILATSLALGLAWFWDRILCSIGPMFGIHERLRVVIFVPIGEESLKYGVSYLGSLSPTILFFLFGMGEGIYESIHFKHKLDPVLILAGILPHTFFGIFYLFNMPVWIGLLLAVISHFIWNSLILNFKDDCKSSTD
jgi:hypothetical protein